MVLCNIATGTSSSPLSYSAIPSSLSLATSSLEVHRIKSFSILNWNLHCFVQHIELPGNGSPFHHLAFPHLVSPPSVQQGMSTGNVGRFIPKFMVNAIIIIIIIIITLTFIILTGIEQHHPHPCIVSSMPSRANVPFICWMEGRTQYDRTTRKPTFWVLVGPCCIGFQHNTQKAGGRAI